MKAELVVIKTDRSECRESVIETIEDALEQAMAGEIVAVALAIVRPNGAINTARSKTDDVARLLGAMSLAQTRLLRAVDEA